MGKTNVVESTGPRLMLLLSSFVAFIWFVVSNEYRVLFELKTGVPLEPFA
jgi:hypothetical protein